MKKVLFDMRRTTALILLLFTSALYGLRNGKLILRAIRNDNVVPADTMSSVWKSFPTESFSQSMETVL